MRGSANACISISGSRCARTGRTTRVPWRSSGWSDGVSQQPRERIALEPAFVLHHREYRDTSRILDVFTAKHGRLTLFARGARGPKSKLASLLMPFRPLLVSWTGRGDAAQLTGAEPHGEP